MISRLLRLGMGVTLSFFMFGLIGWENGDSSSSSLDSHLLSLYDYSSTPKNNGNNNNSLRGQQQQQEQEDLDSFMIQTNEGEEDWEEYLATSLSSSTTEHNKTPSDDGENDDDDDGQEFTSDDSTSSSNIDGDGDDDGDDSNSNSNGDDSTNDDDDLETTLNTQDVVTEMLHGDEDSLTLANMDLIRVRPRNLSMVFVGDSITRYQYLSLAYFLRYGRWYDPTTFPNNLVHAHSFHHDFHPREDWNEFFMQSNRMLQPFELCDCVRKDNTVAIERRYFFDESRNNTLVYINISGKSTLGYEGLYGRVDPTTVFKKPFQSGLFRESPTTTLAQDAAMVTNQLHHVALHGGAWEYFTWADLIEYHVGELNLGPSAVAILNAGLHPSSFQDSLKAVALKEALEMVGVKGVWKTTTFTKDQVLNAQQKQRQQLYSAEIKMRELDQVMCQHLGECFNLAWTAQLSPNLYYDQLHFGEPVYRILNEDLLSQLGLLPEHYRNKLDHSLVVV